MLFSIASLKNNTIQFNTCIMAEIQEFNKQAIIKALQTVGKNSMIVDSLEQFENNGAKVDFRKALTVVEVNQLTSNYTINGKVKKLKPTYNLLSIWLKDDELKVKDIITFEPNKMTVISRIKLFKEGFNILTSVASSNIDTNTLDALCKNPFSMVNVKSHWFGKQYFLLPTDDEINTFINAMESDKSMIDTLKVACNRANFSFNKLFTTDEAEAIANLNE